MGNAAIGTRKFGLARSIMALIMREMGSTYGRSPGGYIWTFAEPLGGIALMSIAFSLIARQPALGTNFPIFFASGIMPFMIYQSTALKVGQAIRYSRSLMAYPAVTYMDAIIARLILNMLTQTMVTIVLLWAIIVIYGLRLNIDFVQCFLAIVMATALGFSIGVVNCYLMSAFAVWQVVWSVLNRPLFIASGIIFLIDPLPEPFRNLLLYNPVAHPIMQMRRGIYDTYDAPYLSSLYVYLIVLFTMAFGLLLLHRYHRILMDEGI